jgi:hypothetical protein
MEWSSNKKNGIIPFFPEKDRVLGGIFCWEDRIVLILKFLMIGKPGIQTSPGSEVASL